MVNLSILFGVPLVEYIIVAVVSVTTIEAAVISLFVVYVIVPLPVLNLRLFGAVNIIVLFV
jgi:hypothetical protein